MGIKTDSTPLGQPLNPEACNVFALYSLFASGEERAALAADYRGGKIGYGGAKKLLKAKLDEYFGPARARRKKLAEDREYVEEVLHRGAKRARYEAQQTMELVRAAVGMKPRPVAG